MSILKNACSECGGDWYTTTEQCNTHECRGHRKENKKIFVYGTLRKGFALNPYMNAFKFLGTATLKGFEMYSNGYYPMIVKSTDEIKREIIGEVYEIENGENEINVLDRIEGAYKRVKVKVKLNGKLTKVETYVYEGDVTFMDYIESGNWILRI